MLATKARMRPIRLVIADRRPIVLQGFATLLAAEGDFTIVASCLDGASCLEAVRTLAPDLVLVEDGFSDVTACDMLAVVKAENIPARLIFYIASVSPGDLAAAVAEGACGAISMREEPEALVQSLRLVAPTRAPAAAGHEQNGAKGAGGLLTDQERKIMRLVAYGMSNRQIARQLKVSPSTIKLRLDRISEQLGIRSRTEISAFALSRLYGGIGALAALLYAVLDDIRPADAAAFGHDLADALNVKTPDGIAETFTIKIDAKKSMPSPVKTAKSVFKLGRVDNPMAETPGRVSKPVQSSIDIGAGTITPSATSSARAALSSFGAFMATAVAIWISEVASSVAQASNLGDSIAGPASAPDHGTGELAAALHSPGHADAHLDSLAWFHPETSHQAFAFEPAGSDTIAGHDGALQLVSADPGGDGVGSSGKAHVGSGSIDAVIDHGSGGQAAATDTSGKPEPNAMQATTGDESNPDQSQAGLHGAEGDAAAAKQNGDDGSAEDDATQGQSQRDATDSKDESVAAAQHAEHDTPDDKSNHGDSRRDSHGPEARPAAAEQHAEDDAKPAHDANSGPSGKAHMPAAPELEDSFHFKTEMASSDTSNKSEVHGGHAPDFIDDGLHIGGSHGLPPIQQSDLIGPSGAEQSDLHQANDAGHHLTQDLFV